MLARAQKKFDQMDVDGDGKLDGSEMLKLGAWVWQSFHPGGEPLTPEKQAEMAVKLMRRCDKNHKGVLTMAEFADWFTNECAEIARFRKGFAARHSKSKDKKKRPKQQAPPRQPQQQPQSPQPQPQQQPQPQPLSPQQQHETVQ